MRVRSAVVAACVALALATATVPAGASPEHQSSAETAVEWLASKTTPDGLVPSSEGYGDVSITLDSILAAAAADHGAPVSGWLEAVAPSLAERATFDAGMIGKALIAADAVGADVTNLGGVDLRATAIDSFTKGNAPGWAGADDAREGTNAFAQALVMIGVARTSELPPATVDFVISQQCADGGFPMYFTPQEGCGSSASDPDGTALIAMALRAAAADCVATAHDPLALATTWLTAQQQPSGAFLGAAPWTAIENTNSTGVIAGYLARAGEPGAAARAAEWVAGLQLSAGGPEAGSIAYDPTSAGADQTIAVWQNIRSTPQAVLALTGESYDTLQLSGTTSAGGAFPCAAELVRDVGLPPTGA